MKGLEGPESIMYIYKYNSSWKDCIKERLRLIPITFPVLTLEADTMGLRDCGGVSDTIMGPRRSLSLFTIHFLGID